MGHFRGIKREDIRTWGTNILSFQGNISPLLFFPSIRFSPFNPHRKPCSTSPPFSRHNSSIVRNPRSRLFSLRGLRFSTLEMKFGKRLSNQIEETLPEWRDKFLSYKDLKKRLKLIEPSSAERPPPSKRPRLIPPDGGAADDAGGKGRGGEEDSSSAGAGAAGTSAFMTDEEEGFISLLEAEIDKFNAFFMEQEEEYIIRQKVRIIASPLPSAAVFFILRVFFFYPPSKKIARMNSRNGLPKITTVHTSGVENFGRPDPRRTPGHPRCTSRGILYPDLLDRCSTPNFQEP